MDGATYDQVPLLYENTYPAEAELPIPKQVVAPGQTIWLRVTPLGSPEIVFAVQVTPNGALEPVIAPERTLPAFAPVPRAKQAGDVALTQTICVNAVHPLGRLLFAQEAELPG